MITGIAPKKLLVIAFVLLIAGFVLPLLMVMRYLPSTFLLNFLAYASSFLGVILGIIGAISIAASGRKRDM